MSSKKAGVVLGYIAMAIKSISSFLLTPLMLVVFGNDEFGVYKLVLSITSYFALADLGLSNAIVRYISEYKVLKDRISEGKFVGLVVIIDLIMAGLLFILGLLFYYNIPQIFDSSFSQKDISIVENLFFLVVISGVFTMFVNLASGILKSYKKFALLKKVNIAKTLIRVGLIAALLLLDFKSFAIVLVDTILVALLFVYLWIYCLRELKIRPTFLNIDYLFAKKILSYSFIVFLDAIAFHFFWAADTFIIGVYISSEAIAIYSIGTILSSLFFAFSIVISEVLMPDIVELVKTGANRHKLTDHLIKIGRIKFIILALPTLGFVFLGVPFIGIWVGEEFHDAYIIGLLVLIPQMTAGLADVALFIMWAKNKHKVKSLVSLGICIANIFLTIVLVQKYGIVGAAISTCLAYVTGYIIFNNIYFHKVLKLDMIRFIRETFKGLSVGFLIAIIGCYFITIHKTTDILIFLLQCLGITFIYVLSLWFFGFNSSEKRTVTKPLKRIFATFRS